MTISESGMRFAKEFEISLPIFAVFRSNPRELQTASIFNIESGKIVWHIHYNYINNIFSFIQDPKVLEHLNISNL